MATVGTWNRHEKGTGLTARHLSRQGHQSPSIACLQFLALITVAIHESCSLSPKI